MPVVAVTRKTLRGKIRGQTKYAITLMDRMIKAWQKNPGLALFFTGTVDQPGSIASAQFLKNQWAAALELRD